MSTLCGIVTLKPDIPTALKAFIDSSSCPFGTRNAIYVQFRPNELKAALCIDGDNE